MERKKELLDFAPIIPKQPLEASLAVLQRPLQNSKISQIVGEKREPQRNEMDLLFLDEVK